MFFLLTFLQTTIENVPYVWKRRLIFVKFHVCFTLNISNYLNCFVTCNALVIILLTQKTKTYIKEVCVITERHLILEAIGRRTAVTWGDQTETKQLTLPILS